MAREARYVLIDDIDGSPAKETVRFAVGRDYFEIDLKERHVEEFDADLSRWVKHARRLPSRAAESSAQAVGGVNDAPLIRAWAREHGMELATRGRIPAAIREQYYAEMFELETSRSDYSGS